MKIGLALGGGGARGAAHIGVVMELERLGIRPSLITGTSVGGLVGALLAAGFSPAEMTDFFHHITVGAIYGLPGGAPSISTNTKLEKLLREKLEERTFADLHIPLAVVTTDLVTRKQVVLDEGDVVTAVLATTALPIIFPPVQVGEQLLIDGGLLNNTPFDVARARGATYVIAVSLSNTAPFGTPPTDPAPPPDVLSKALAFTRRRPTLQVLSTISDIWADVTVRTRLAISPPDLLLEPYLGTIGLFDSHLVDQGIEAGKTAVREAEAVLMEELYQGKQKPVSSGQHLSDASHDPS